jgi:hypothetical protein
MAQNHNSILRPHALCSGKWLWGSAPWDLARTWPTRVAEVSMLRKREVMVTKSEVNENVLDWLSLELRHSDSTKVDSSVLFRDSIAKVAQPTAQQKFRRGHIQRFRKPRHCIPSD